MSDAIRVERAGPIATIWLDHPPVNAMTSGMLQALQAALEELGGRREIRCLILAGAGERAFCAGADLHEQQSLAEPAAAAAFRSLARQTVSALEQCRKPVVAAINGWCIGGGTALAWSCDIRLAAEGATFRTADAYLGILPAWGMALQRLPRLLGRCQTLDLLLLGEDFGARRAYELGLVSRVVPGAELMAAAQATARRIAAASPAAILATRQAVRFSLSHGWEESAAFEEARAAELSAHPDAREGMEAFLAKRRADFLDGDGLTPSKLS